jgi:hypothetical protein
MVLKAILDSLDEVAEPIREHYVERNGKYELAAEGFRTQADVDRLNAALVKERNDHKVVRERYAPLATLGVDTDVILDRVTRFPELEIASQGKIDDKKLEEIVGQRLSAKLSPVERELKIARDAVAERDGLINQYKDRDRVNTIHESVRQAATKANMLPAALEDALMLGERVFEIDETGRVVTRDGVGVTPGVDAAVWLADMQAKRPHWWPTSQGAGAGGGGRQIPGGGTGGNPFTAESWNMTEQGRLFKENPQRAHDMAKAAGTTVGGRKPMPRR